jgi:capsular polysaccharide transport system permease protein
MTDFLNRLGRRRFAAGGRRPGRERDDALTATVRWLDLLVFLVIHDFGDRYRQSKLSAFFTVFEPLGLITVLSLAQVVIGGGSLWVDAHFHTTGILAYYLFFHITLRVRSSEVFRLPPRVSRFDQLLSHVLCELIAKGAIAAVLFVFFAYMGVPNAIPFDPFALIAPLALICLMGVGVGLINTFISFYFAGWSYLYAIVARAMMALAGVLIRPDMMPPNLRHFVVWNPVFHAVTWFRSGCFPHYPVDLLHKDFLVYSVAGILALGVVLDASMRETRWSR